MTYQLKVMPDGKVIGARRVSSVENLDQAVLVEWEDISHIRIWDYYYLEKDPETEEIKIVYKPPQTTPEQITAEREAAIKATIQAELPGLVYQYRDNPAGLAQALCSRAKAIEVETK